MRLWIVSLTIWASLPCCGQHSSGPLPTAQRAGEVARESTAARAFMELYPAAIAQASPDRCPGEQGKGRRCEDASHFDVTFTHTIEGTGPRTVQLLVEVGRAEKVLGTIPRPLLVYEEKACEADSDCMCATCSSCFNVVHGPAKLMGRKEGCRPAPCALAGCVCRGGICRTR